MKQQRPLLKYLCCQDSESYVSFFSTRLGQQKNPASKDPSHHCKAFLYHTVLHKFKFQEGLTTMPPTQIFMLSRAICILISPDHPDQQKNPRLKGSLSPMQCHSLPYCKHLSYRRDYQQCPLLKYLCCQ
jgi:hypothetical protein